MKLLSKGIIAWLNRERPGRYFPLSDYERIRYEVKQCDVILVEGRTRVSDVIRMVTQSPWSHAALFLGRIHDIEDPDLRTIVSHYYGGDPSDQLIIESQLGLGTVIRSLEVYRNEHIRLARPSGLSYRDSQQVIRYAISRLGVDYDVRQIFDLARFLFPWSVLPRRWRSSLFKRKPGMTTRTVCSTMIAEAFGYVQFPILPLVKHTGNSGVQLFRRNPRLCTPSDFDYSPYFEIIKYPFLDFTHHSDYRLLPWHGSAALVGEEDGVYLSLGEEPTPADVDDAIRNAMEQTTTTGSIRLQGEPEETQPETQPRRSPPGSDRQGRTDALAEGGNDVSRAHLSAPASPDAVPAEIPGRQWPARTPKPAPEATPDDSGRGVQPAEEGEATAQNFSVAVTQKLNELIARIDSMRQSDEPDSTDRDGTPENRRAHAGSHDDRSGG